MTVRERRIPFMMSEAEVANLDQWRFANRVPTRSEAIRQLVVNGMIDRPAGAAEPTDAKTLRDYLAGQAISNPEMTASWTRSWTNDAMHLMGVREWYALQAYGYADAMLAARETKL